MLQRSFIPKCVVARGDSAARSLGEAVHWVVKKVTGAGPAATAIAFALDYTPSGAEVSYEVNGLAVHIGLPHAPTSRYLLSL
jgi:hypothetical protein